jgi:hypothetical protein
MFEHRRSNLGSISDNAALRPSSIFARRVRYFDFMYVNAKNANCQGSDVTNDKRIRIANFATTGYSFLKVNQKSHTPLFRNTNSRVLSLDS